MREVEAVKTGEQRQQVEAHLTAQDAIYADIWKLGLSTNLIAFGEVWVDAGFGQYRTLTNAWSEIVQLDYSQFGTTGRQVEPRTVEVKLHKGSIGTHHHGFTAADTGCSTCRKVRLCLRSNTAGSNNLDNSDFKQPSFQLLKVAAP